MIAGVPRQGGAAWAVVQFVLGLERLGHDVVFVEQVGADALRPRGAPLERSDNAAYLADVSAELGLRGRTALVLAGGDESSGVPYSELRRRCERADLLVNISGILTDEELTGPVPTRLYLDLDPAFTQVWQAQGIDVGLAGHTHFATVGLAIGAPSCPVPTGGIDWITTLPPVVLERWPRASRIEIDALTTVTHWRGYGSVEHEGVHYGQKVHSFRPLMALPTKTDARFVLALAIHPDEERDLAALRENGWELVDADERAGTPAAYQRFVQGSWAELGVAKSGYVASRCGWFSDRSACYLASGRPVIAQETGFSAFLPAGEGLLAFQGEDDVLEAVETLRRDYDGHARAARAVAEEQLDSDRVLGSLLDQLGLA
jgi:hypothetical protein